MSVSLSGRIPAIVEGEIESADLQVSQWVSFSKFEPISNKNLDSFFFKVIERVHNSDHLTLETVSGHLLDYSPVTNIMNDNVSYEVYITGEKAYVHSQLESETFDSYKKALSFAALSRIMTAVPVEPLTRDICRIVESYKM